MASWRQSLQQMIYSGGMPIRIVATSGQPAIVYDDASLQMPLDAIDSNRLVEVQQQRRDKAINDAYNSQSNAAEPHSQTFSPVETQSQLTHSYRGEPLPTASRANPNFADIFTQQQRVTPSQAQSNRIDQRQSAQVFGNVRPEIRFPIDDYRNRISSEHFMSPIEISNQVNRVESAMPSPVPIGSLEMQLPNERYFGGGDRMSRGLDGDSDGGFSSNAAASASHSQPAVHYENQRNQFSFISDQPVQRAAHQPPPRPFAPASPSRRTPSQWPAAADPTLLMFDDVSQRLSDDFRAPSSQNSDDIHGFGRGPSPSRSQPPHVRDDNDGVHQAQDFSDSLSDDVGKTSATDGSSYPAPGRDLHLRAISRSPVVTPPSVSPLGQQMERNSSAEEAGAALPRPGHASVTTFPRFESMRLAIESDGRRPSADSLPTSKTDDDLPRQRAKAILQRRYSVASNVHDSLPASVSQSNFLSAPFDWQATRYAPMPGSVNHADEREVRTPAQDDAAGWSAMETMTRYSDNDFENAKDFSSEKNELSFNESAALAEPERNSIEQRMDEMRLADGADEQTDIHHTLGWNEKAPIHR